MVSPRPDLIRVLDVDPDLARDLEPEEARRARERLVARTCILPAGRREGTWGPRDSSGYLGLLVVDGLVLRQLTIGRSRCAELLGTPDLLRPWDHDGGFSLPTGARIDWEVFVDTRLAMLDVGFVRRASEWPEIVAALGGRGVWRAQSLAVHQAISHLNRVDERVLLLLWHLADRWGKVNTNGIEIELNLTHDLIGRLVGAQRPSVTTALGQLHQRGLVERLPNRSWMLPHTSAAAIEPLFAAVP